MYQLNLGDLTIDQFLSEYWQKKPLFIKGAFKAFNDPISADELAGLAMEPEVESRIIRKLKNNDWQVEHGPFETFDQYGETNWSLLVQATNNWSAETQQLIKPFQFLPNWRIDDVMVSYSTPNGGVGPHLDQYDVFIIQGEGKRRWQVGLPDDSLTELFPHPDLKQVSEFTPIIDVETQAGDLLYIPPNHPHCGTAISHAMNFSIGFQAPNSQDVWSCYADMLIDSNEGLSRFTDKNRQATTEPHILTSTDIKALTHFLLSELSEEKSCQLFGRFLTQNHHELEILAPVAPLTEQQIDQILNEPEIELKPVLGIKALITENGTLFINGDNLGNYSLNLFVENIAKNQSMTIGSIKSSMDCLKNKQLLTTVLNKGYWFID